MLKFLKKIVFSRTVIFVSSVLVQLFILFGIYYVFNEYIGYFYLLFVLLEFTIIVELLNNQSNPMFKMAWIIPILIIPIFGILLYIFFNNQVRTKKISERVDYLDKKYSKNIKQDCFLYEEIYNKNSHIANLVKYMNVYGNYPIYKNTESSYFAFGQDYFDDLIKELKNAKNYIFMEHFIVAHGRLWYNILEILKQKVREGVEVYFMYDGMCAISNLTFDYPEQLEAYGIKCKMFNKIIPVAASIQNNRDHRKITVIDGKIAYTGGINIADEYINEVERFGYWKDTGIKIKGEAVKSFVTMFLTMWNVDEKKSGNIQKYLYDYKAITSDGYVMPYSDSPLDKNETGKDVYLDIINTATKYVHITTPYLILDYELLSSIKYAAKRGVEVIIITPHIPDKWYVYTVSRSFYKELLDAGVKIYEYTPGFIHAKMCISDNEEAIVGTMNFDYRSLYMNFENAVYLYKSKTIKAIEDDFEDTLNKCELITNSDEEKYNIIKKIIGKILRLFAPIM